MLKVLIVDDEPLVREGLKNIIPWEDYNFSICGEGSDGRDGLNEIKQLKPDLVLIDIKMPGLPGIEVMRQAREQGYQCKFIILTGYSDFQYAKSSIELGVESYLLKPIDEDELIENVRKVAKQIEEEQVIKMHVENSEKYMREAIIRDILLSNVDIECVNGIFNDECSVFRAAILDIVDSIKDRDKINNEIIKLIEDNFIRLINLEALVVDNKVCVLFINQEKDIVIDILKKISNNIESYLNKEVFISVGSVENNCESIGNSYRTARMLGDKKFIFLGKTNIVLADDVETNTISIGNFDIEKFEQELSTYIEINDEEKIIRILDRIEFNFTKSDYSAEMIKSICSNIYVKIKYNLIDNYDELEDYFPMDSYIIQQVYKMDRLSSIISYLHKEFTCIGTKICNSCSGNVMKRILSYIEKNYYKDLKLETLAEIFNYNSAYLGKIFKNYTNETFNTYVDKVRIENAKKLLLENKLKVYKISEKVGYKNTDYFYGKFKKYVGVSPKEFIKQEAYN
ncbi:response regulator transcription factor [Clostridium oryzae]|uniref:Stage 0 sporulation protein A homolog n=1 Tax=Clostridium oryzae TaxID=1450648 RepID=A0A1V4IYI5_9CLOT|nr:response regulator [Clostridium oryzae]OPJ65128.1 putative response regulatory protein [Clostridium oryzae]